MFKRVLIANRGEIAVRIMRACRELDIETVAVFSEVDRSARHVRYADYAFPIGGGPATESYLCQERIIEAALQAKAEAIHPGYGFLAENAAFARAVETAGLVFVGPRPETIALLGDKIAARHMASSAGIPVVPGVEQTISSADEAAEVAQQVGYPLLIKAAAGGGGKGMRIVRTPAELPEAVRAARSESQSAFGDGRIYIEKYLEQPRHVEIQVIADSHGTVCHLGERECSIQRRHQKVVEESPSPIVDQALRAAMGEAAVRAARAAGYLNAGTVEFLLDAQRNFYFLEVNTRLQVEHPVTEMVTGIDLVKEQLRVAAGLPLSFRQEEVHWRGAAIECRIYAEDPENDFLPSTGTVSSYREPGGPGVRVDSGIGQGDQISIHYDPLIAKLIVWGQTRAEAIARMRRALSEYTIMGVKTTIPFHLALMANPRFVEGRLSTHFIQEEFAQQTMEAAPTDRQLLAAMASLACILDSQRQQSARPSDNTSPRMGAWKLAGRRRAIEKY
ncbi:MAG: acetyl-CoA carboxylase biotin carboxylase subunit [Calditrichaeota bacterium]|nr:acetyl-CoA carboxylase biotin carboxylase subunit [Calditrichota bacterium]